MSYNGHSGSHWQNVAVHFFLDAFIVGIAFYLATYVRLADHEHFFDSFSGLILGAGTFSCTAYILGLYAFEESENSFLGRCLSLLVSLFVAFIVMAIFFYATLSFHIGRGIMGLGCICSFLLLIPHHLELYRRRVRRQDRIAFVMLNEDDEKELRFLEELRSDAVTLVGVVSPGYALHPGEQRYRTLGSLDELEAIVQRENLSMLVYAGQAMSSPSTQAAFRQLRYSGFQLIPAVSICEKVYRFVPLGLVNDLWLYHASISPHSFYIRKIKRAFDIISSLIGLVVFSPFLLLGLLAVRLTSPGPLFYRQIRSGKNGRRIEVLKLRTMVVDAEKNGAAWAGGSSDPRLTPVGGLLRKYRIDEIPQLLNVLKGEMSFVGPRPERPELIEMISKEIPLFPERLMVSPGLTGWAQVNYPYGASIEDAAHKLEYDFYYMKHMSIFLDVLIILDTVRLILRGGLGAKDMKKRRWLDVSRSFRQREQSAP